MATVTDSPRKSPDNHQWVFRWRPLRQPLFPKLIALALVGGGFALLVTSVRVRVNTLEKSTPRKASVIFLRDDAQGRALSLRAQEGGPFPSRFDLSQWGGLATLENAAMDTIRFQPPTYELDIEDLPISKPVEPLVFAAKGERYFPEHAPVSDEIPDTAGLKLAPVLYPLSGDPIPVALPPFGAAVDAAMSSASWRFLLRLNPEGSVEESVSLENADEADALELEKWLHKIRFNPEPGKPFRWIAVGIGFTNQPVSDGTDAR